MSANDKAAATYGRKPMTIADVLGAHQQAVSTSCGPEDHCDCDDPLDKVSIADHQADMLEPLIVGREHEASRQALMDAANALTRDSVPDKWGTGPTYGNYAAWLRARAEQ